MSKSLIPISLIIICPLLLLAQETEVIKKTAIYARPGDKDSALGYLLPGGRVAKIQKDRSGQYIKATIEFYIPLETLEEGRIAKQIGETQIADAAAFKLLDSRRSQNRIHLRLQVTNNSAQNLDFAPMMLLRVIGKGEIRGELNPFEGTNQGLVTIAPNRSITADLVYDFKKPPSKVELVCTGKMGGDRVYYSLGF